MPLGACTLGRNANRGLPGSATFAVSGEAALRLRMPRSPIKTRWIKVTRRADGMMFVDNIMVTIDPKQKHSPPPWRLSEDTALALGLAEQGWWRVPGFGDDGIASCRCVPGRHCTEAVRLGRNCRKPPPVFRNDGSVRLHVCLVCCEPFIAHHATRVCSGACAKRSAAAWREAHRTPRKASKAAQRRKALASVRCKVCDVPFRPMRLSARFCSDACRQKAHRGVRSELAHAAGSARLAVSDTTESSSGQ
jgi:hypothetical protein